MLSRAQIDSLDRLPGTILTVYMNTQKDEPARHLPVPHSLTWLRNQAKSIANRLTSTERDQFEAQWNRVETFLDGRPPHEKALVIFAGPNTWELVPLPVGVENDLRWGRPASSQLLLLADEHKPYCVVVVDRTKARFLRYQFAGLREIEEYLFPLDDSQWKTIDMGHVTGQRIHKTRGSQRDSYDHRVEAQYARFCRETARRAASLCRREKLEAVILVGASHLVVPIAAGIPPQFRESLLLIREDLGGIPIQELSPRLAAPIREWQQQRAESLVSDLLSARHGVFTTPDEVIAELQKGAISEIVVASDFAPSLFECDRCGWADRSTEQFCPKCRTRRRIATLKEVLPRLAKNHKTRLFVVDGDPAATLRKAGGIGGWRRLTVSDRTLENRALSYTR